VLSLWSDTVQEASHAVGDVRRQNADAGEDVEGREDLPKRRLRREVPVSDGGERDHAQLVRIHPRHVLDEVVDHSADTERNGNDAKKDPKDMAIKCLIHIAHARVPFLGDDNGLAVLGDDNGVAGRGVLMRGRVRILGNVGRCGAPGAVAGPRKWVHLVLEPGCD